MQDLSNRAVPTLTLLVLTLGLGLAVQASHALANTLPTAAPDAVQTHARSAVLIDLLANDEDGDGDALSVSISAAPFRGTLVDHGDGTVTYTPDPALFEGSGGDGFTYTVDDGRGGVASAAVTVTELPVPPELRPITETLLLEETFDSGLANWSFEDFGVNFAPSSWSVSNGELVQTSNIWGDPAERGTYAVYTGGSGWTDYRIQTKLRSHDDDRLGVLFRYQDSDNHYRFDWAGETSSRRLVKIENGTQVVLAEDSISYVWKDDFLVEITAEGSQIEVLVDGQPLFSVIDGSFASGSVGFNSSGNAGSYFDDLRVTALPQAPYPLLFEDRFDDGDSEGWILADSGTVSFPSSWQVTNGELAQTSNIFGSSFFGVSSTGAIAEAGHGWRNYRFRVKARAEDDDGLVFSVTLPDLSQFQMTYIQSAADQRNVFEEPGMIRSLKLPTLGRTEWEYSLYTFPEQQPEEPGELEPPQPWSTGEGVRFKRVFDRGGTLLGQWAYQQGGRPPTQPAPPPIDGAGALEVRTWVTDPHGHDTVHYFQNDPGDFGYGLPFTKLLTDGTGTRFLSRESFQGSATGGASSLLRTEYLRYENDPATFEGNERIAAQRTVYHDDGGRTADVAFSDFDGHGHYRTATTGGTFGAGDVRTTFTDYNPDRGTLGQAGFTAWPTTDPWVLETFTEQRVTEGGQTVVRQTCFDPATGVLLAERLLAGASPGSADVLRSYTYDTMGSLIREEHAGGDVQTVGTSADLCLVTPPSAQYVLRHTTQNGVRAKTESLDGTRVLLTSLDQDIDASTGLPAVTRDPAGQATTFTYDLMGRVVREEPPGGEAPRVTVFDKAGLGPAKITVTREDPVSPGVELQRAEFELDDLGRLAKERHRLPGGVFNQRLTSYTPAGFKSGVTELQPDGTAGTSLRWTFFGYEPFGRVASITAPDGHAVTLDYQGIRQVDRHIQGVATSTTGTEQTATTTETYDRQGRLIAVTQPAGSGGQLVTTSYGYDPANRLTQVSTTAEGVTQLRTFDYDGRGFLLSEQHPEIDGAVLYSDYDALGNVGRKRSGQEAGGGYHTDLGFTCDPAGRLVRVKETGGRVFKEMFYATANAGGDLRQGKLFQAKRHNYVPDPANPGVDLHRVVTETFRYEGQGGRLSEKRLRGSDAVGAGAASFTQSYTYDPLGNVQDEIYPLCVSPRCDGYGPPRVVSYQYDQGVLAAIPGWLTSITYRRNGLIKKITHRNGMVDTWGNDLDWMRRPRSIAFSGRSSLNLGTYLYDGAGNIKSIGSDLFAYDLVSRLVKADLSLGKSQDYTFDAYGNLTSIVTTTGAVPDSRPIGVAPATNRLTGAGYDAAGNVTSLFTLTSLTYDPFNRVTQMTGTGVNRSFLYDTSDDRVAILDHQASTEEWLLRGLHEKVVRSFLAKPEGWSWKQDWVYREGQLVASSAPGRWREYHLDHLGTPRLVTGPIGLKEAEYHPFPFGEMASESGPAMEAREGLFRYTGHQRDTNCEGCAEEAQDDLDYMLARFYSPRVGRFLAVDPSQSGRSQHPQTWSRFGYALNNPIRKVDPDGRQTVDTVDQNLLLFRRLSPAELIRELNRRNEAKVNATSAESEKAKNALKTGLAIAAIATAVTSFDDIFSASEPEDPNKPEIRRQQGTKEEAFQQFEAAAEPGSITTRGQGVFTARDKETGRTLIFRERSSDQRSLVTIEEQRKTTGGKTRSRKVRFDFSEDCCQSTQE